MCRALVAEARRPLIAACRLRIHDNITDCPRLSATVQGALVEAMLRVSDPDAHGVRWLTPLQPQLTALQSCAPADRARREHAVRNVSVLALWIGRCQHTVVSSTN